MNKEKAIKNKRIKKVNYHLKSIFLLACSCFFIFNIAKELITAKQIRDELKQEQELAQTILNETEKLKKQKEMLQDPNYALNYARGKLLISQDGEQIFSLDDRK